jgi:membrane-associated phospholipid phosphatase
MNVWKSRAARWGILLACYAAIWGAVHAFGLYGVPLVNGLDRAISEAVNPDLYTPVLDEFFRSLTDYSNFVFALPLISLAVAVGLYSLARMSPGQAALRAGIACALWWVSLGLISVIEDAPVKLVYALAVVPPVLIVVGALPPMLIPALPAKRWLTGLLCVESAAVLAFWATGRLWWNEGLAGANYMLLPFLLLFFGGMVYVFHLMRDEDKKRYVGIFWLVLLSIVMVSLGATNETKDSIARPRPMAESNQPWNEALRTIPEEVLRGASSYPSGHTSGTFALITPLFWWLQSRRLRAALLGWGVLQGVSRIYTVAHFTSDCIMGGLLGFSVGTLIFFLLNGQAHRIPRREPVS